MNKLVSGTVHGQTGYFSTPYGHYMIYLQIIGVRQGWKKTLYVHGRCQAPTMPDTNLF
ncbi:hypothetical protein ACQKP0_08255 [Heyndrickxia sp. NPDC080065]|uniref:hypothetical protein n=1 Tax=Heyndrickxia sp. NPDC080065 TaxID=3390568 RepID=UPI003D092F55